MGRITNPFHKLVVVIQGAGALEVGSRIVSLKANHVVRVVPEQVHRFVDEPSAPMTLSVLCISPPVARNELNGLWRQVERQIPRARAAVISPGHAAEIYALNREIAVEGSAGLVNAKSMITGLAQEMIVQLLRGLDQSPIPDTTRSGTAFASTLLWIDRHFNQPVSITELAERADMSYRSFTAHFQRHREATVTQYVTAKRVELAANLITSGSDILQAAFEAGFVDISHFYRLFHRHTGTTPGRIISGCHVNAREEL